MVAVCHGEPSTDSQETRWSGHRKSASRADFVRRHFHTEAVDPHYYDLVVDTARFGFGATADLVCRALELSGMTA